MRDTAAAASTSTLQLILQHTYCSIYCSIPTPQGPTTAYTAAATCTHTSLHILHVPGTYCSISLQHILQHIILQLLHTAYCGTFTKHHPLRMMLLTRSSSLIYWTSLCNYMLHFLMFQSTANIYLQAYILKVNKSAESIHEPNKKWQKKCVNGDDKNCDKNN